MPLGDRPYEKLELLGESSLTNSELLAIIIKTGSRNSSVYELCLAEVLVEGGSTEIKQSNITDTRLLNDVCGMCSSLAEIDTQTLYTQMTTQFDFVDCLQHLHLIEF